MAKDDKKPEDPKDRGDAGKSKNLICQYCGEEPPAVDYDDGKPAEYHQCSVTGLMTPYASKKAIADGKNKNRVVEQVPDETPLRSYVETVGSDDPLLGAPTRGRR